MAVDAALAAADRMADWIERRHADMHDIVRVELIGATLKDEPDRCEGCDAMKAYREARNAEHE